MEMFGIGWRSQKKWSINLILDLVLNNLSCFLLVPHSTLSVHKLDQNLCAKTFIWAKQVEFLVFDS